MPEAHKMAFFSLCLITASLFYLTVVATTILLHRAWSSVQTCGFLLLLSSILSRHTSVALASLCLGYPARSFLIAD